MSGDKSSPKKSVRKMREREYDSAYFVYIYVYCHLV